MQGILLAGGLGTRLNPITRSLNKHLLPIFDKPMIYYPITTLILAGVKDICIVSTSQGIIHFQNLLGNGSQWGINLTYAVQDFSNGIVDGIEIGLQNFQTNESKLVILGDNIFYGSGLGRRISESIEQNTCRIWVQEVEDPQNFGIAVLDQNGQLLSIEEKPKKYRGKLAVTGLYYFPPDLSEKIAGIKKSQRGEKEITEVLNRYLDRGELEMEELTRGVFWLDSGTVENLLEASQFVRIIQHRQGSMIGSPDEAALKMNIISNEEFQTLVSEMNDSSYKNQLLKLLQY